jgi:hypothetical protein
MRVQCAAMELAILGPLRVGGPGSARLWGAAGAARQPDEAAFAERVEGTLRNAVGPAAFTRTDAVALALDPDGV